MIPPQQQPQPKWKVASLCVFLSGLLVLSIYLPLYFSPAKVISPLERIDIVAVRLVDSTHTDRIQLLLSANMNVSQSGLHPNDLDVISLQLYDAESDAFIGRLESIDIQFLYDNTFNLSMELHFDPDNDEELGSLVTCIMSGHSCDVCAVWTSLTL